VAERVALPARPSDGGGLPSTEADLAARLEHGSDAMIDALLERSIHNERVLRSKLDFVQMQIRVAQAEKARRRNGADVGPLVGT